MNDDLDQRIKAAHLALCEAQKAKRDAERAAEEKEIAATLVEHARLVVESSGLRREILQLHAPHPDPGGYTYCSICFTSNGYEKQFPCVTYQLAAGQAGAHPAESDKEN